MTSRHIHLGMDAENVALPANVFVARLPNTTFIRSRGVVHIKGPHLVQLPAGRLKGGVGVRPELYIISKGFMTFVVLCW